MRQKADCVARKKKGDKMRNIYDDASAIVASGPNKPYKKPGLAYRPGQARPRG